MAVQPQTGSLRLGQPRRLIEGNREQCDSCGAVLLQRRGHSLHPIGAPGWVRQRAASDETDQNDESERQRQQGTRRANRGTADDSEEEGWFMVVTLLRRLVTSEGLRVAAGAMRQPLRIIRIP